MSKVHKKKKQENDAEAAEQMRKWLTTPNNKKSAHPVTFKMFSSVVKNLPDIAFQIQCNEIDGVNKTLDECAHWYYNAFYSDPAVRTKYEFTLRSCPLAVKEKLLQMPSNGAPAACNRVQREDGVVVKVSRCGLFMFPVSLATFKEYINEENVLENLVNQATKNPAKRAAMLADKKTCRTLLKKYYNCFYVFPNRRNLEKCPLKEAPFPLAEQLLKVASPLNMEAVKTLENNLSKVRGRNSKEHTQSSSLLSINISSTCSLESIVSFKVFEKYIKNIYDIVYRLKLNEPDYAYKGFEDCAYAYYLAFYLTPEIREKYQYELGPCTTAMSNRILALPNEEDTNKLLQLQRASAPFSQYQVESQVVDINGNEPTPEISDGAPCKPTEEQQLAPESQQLDDSSIECDSSKDQLLSDIEGVDVCDEEIQVQVTPPVSFDQFKRSIKNLDEIATQMLSCEEFKHKTQEECVLEYFQQFYTNPQIRDRFEYKLRPCPSKVREKLLSFPENVSADKIMESEGALPAKRNLVTIKGVTYEYPVSFDTFWRYANGNELKTQFVQAYEEQKVNVRGFSDTKLMKHIFHCFYLDENVRHKFNYNFSAAPEELRDKLMQFAKAVRNKDQPEPSVEPTTSKELEQEQEEHIQQTEECDAETEEIQLSACELDVVEDYGLCGRYMFPVSFETFKRCINYKELIRPLLMRVTKDQAQLDAMAADPMHPECDIIFKRYYRSFYVRPMMTRSLFAYRFRKVSAELLNKLLSSAVALDDIARKEMDEAAAEMPQNKAENEEKDQVEPIVEPTQSQELSNKQDEPVMQNEMDCDSEIENFPVCNYVLDVVQDLEEAGRYLFPVSFETFEKCINYKEIIRPLLMRITEDKAQVDAMAADRRHPQCQKIFKRYYRSFYVRPMTTRNLFAYRFVNVSDELLPKFMSFALPLDETAKKHMVENAAEVSQKNTKEQGDDNNRKVLIQSERILITLEDKVYEFPVSYQTFVRYFNYDTIPIELTSLRDFYHSFYTCNEQERNLYSYNFNAAPPDLQQKLLQYAIPLQNNKACVAATESALSLPKDTLPEQLVSVKETPTTEAEIYETEEELYARRRAELARMEKLNVVRYTPYNLSSYIARQIKCPKNRALLQQNYVENKKQKQKLTKAVSKATIEKNTASDLRSTVMETVSTAATTTSEAKAATKTVTAQAATTISEIAVNTPVTTTTTRTTAAVANDTSVKSTAKDLRTAATATKAARTEATTATVTTANTAATATKAAGTEATTATVTTANTAATATKAARTEATTATVTTANTAATATKAARTEATTATVTTANTAATATTVAITTAITVTTTICTTTKSTSATSTSTTSRSSSIEATITASPGASTKESTGPSLSEKLLTLLMQDKNNSRSDSPATTTANFLNASSKEHNLKYLILTSHGLKNAIWRILSCLSFTEFKTYTSIYEGESFYENNSILMQCYSHVLDKGNWPLNLYVKMQLLPQLLHSKGIQLKSFDLSQLSPKMLHWQELFRFSNFHEIAEKVFTARTSEQIEDVTQLFNEILEHYKTCWTHDQWIFQVPQITAEELTQSINSISHQTVEEESDSSTQSISLVPRCMIQDCVESSGEVIANSTPDADKEFPATQLNASSQAAETQNHQTVGEELNPSTQRISLVQRSMSEDCIESSGEVIANPTPDEDIECPATQLSASLCPPGFVDMDAVCPPSQSAETQTDPLNQSNTQETVHIKMEPIKFLNMMRFSPHSSLSGEFICETIPTEDQIIRIDNSEDEQTPDELACFAMCNSRDESLSVSPSVGNLTQNQGDDVNVCLTNGSGQSSMDVLDAPMPSHVSKAPAVLEQRTATVSLDQSEQPVLEKLSTPSTSLPVQITQPVQPVKTNITRKHKHPGTTTTAVPKKKQRLMVDNVPQLRHDFRPLPLIAMVRIEPEGLAAHVNRNMPSPQPQEELPTSQDPPARTVSQELSTDNTLMESSQLQHLLDAPFVSQRKVNEEISDINKPTLTTSIQPIPRKPKNIVFRSLQRFMFFGSLTTAHISNYHINSLSVGNPYQQALITINGQLCNVYGPLLESLFSYCTPSLLADLKYLLSDLGEFSFNRRIVLKKDSTEDLRTRVLTTFMRVASPFAQFRVEFENETREWAACSVMNKPDTENTKRIPICDVSLVIRPEILERMRQVKCSF